MSVQARAPRAGDLRQALSDAIVRVSADFIGRGPTRAKTYVVENIVFCVMQDTLTRGERSLVADDDGESVRQMRRRFQDAMRRHVCAAIEELTDRKAFRAWFRASSDGRWSPARRRAGATGR
jgi:uncharacterized protein YbcI